MLLYSKQPWPVAADAAIMHTHCQTSLKPPLSPHSLATVLSHSHSCTAAALVPLAPHPTGAPHPTPTSPHNHHAQQATPSSLEANGSHACVELQPAATPQHSHTLHMLPHSFHDRPSRNAAPSNLPHILAAAVPPNRRRRRRPATANPRMYVACAVVTVAPSNLTILVCCWSTLQHPQAFELEPYIYMYVACAVVTVAPSNLL